VASVPIILKLIVGFNISRAKEKTVQPVSGMETCHVNTVSYPVIFTIHGLSVTKSLVSALRNGIQPPDHDNLQNGGHFLLKRPQKQIFVLKSRRLFEISLIFVELFLFSSLLMGRCKIGRDLLYFLFLFGICHILVYGLSLLLASFALIYTCKILWIFCGKKEALLDKEFG
jgi:hypothetical protein